MPNYLLHLLFGETASEIAAASPRLTAWSSAFDAYLASLPSQNARKQAINAWRLLIDFHRLPPWSLTRDHIDSFLADLANRGHTASTIRCYRGRISAFYRHCSRKPKLLKVDPLFAHNPVLGAASPQVSTNYSSAYILRPPEARALLRAVDRASTLLGKRDYAFLLTLLLTAIPETALRQLQWRSLHFPVGNPLPVGSPQATAEGVFVQPAPTAALKPLPAPAWDAIHDYLTASARLPSIQPEEYIFCPLAEPLFAPSGSDPEHWLPDHPISTEQLLVSLKTYAAWAGLDPSRITYASLRHAAAFLHLQTGADTAAIQSFLDLCTPKFARRYLTLLASMHARRARPSPNPALRGNVILPTRSFDAQTPARSFGAQAPASFFPNLKFPSTQSPLTVSLRRRRGAQPSNINALKHGFFYPGLLPGDIELLAEIMSQENRNRLERQEQQDAMDALNSVFASLPRNDDEVLAFLDPNTPLREPPQKAPLQPQGQPAASPLDDIIDEISLLRYMGTNLMKGTFSPRLVDPHAINTDIIHLRLLIYRSLREASDLDDFKSMANYLLHSTLAGTKVLRLRRKLG